MGFLGIQTKLDKWSVTRKMMSLSLLMIVLSFPVPSAPAPINILIFHSYHGELPWNRQFDRGVHAFVDSSPLGINVYREFLDVHRIPMAPQRDDWIKVLAKKYQNMNIDVVIGESNEAADFVRKTQHFFAPEAATILYTNEDIASQANRLVLKTDLRNITQNAVAEALIQNEDAKNALVIVGANESSARFADELTKQIASNKDIEIDVLSDFSKSELFERVQAFPKDGVIFYTLVFKDRLGEHFVPRALLGEIADMARAPVYVSFSALLGNGAVGGYVADGATIAKNVLQASIDYKRNGVFNKDYDSAAYFYDWQALEKHDISASLISPESVVINMPSSFIERHYKSIINGLLALISVLLACVILIFLQRRRNLSLEKLNDQLVSSRSELEVSNEKLNRLARVDPLTLLYNRRAALDLIERKLQKPNNKKVRCLQMIDIDNFKSINDQFGHDIGDEVLKSVAAKLLSQVRREDILARWGGEEFLLYSELSDFEDALTKADKLRLQVSIQPINTITLSISIGVTEIKAGEKFDIAFTRADKALYKSKKLGKNRVTVSV